MIPRARRAALATGRWASRLTRLGERIPDGLARLGLGETALLIIIAAFVGGLAGFAILGFYSLLGLAATLAADLAQRLVLSSFWVRTALLFLGLGLARLLVRLGTGDSPEENVPAVMQAVARRGGRLAVKPILVKTLASAIVIGVGGSAGAEGPVAVLGAGTASGTGRWLRFRADRLRLLVGCGAAAGISGAFGAPIAGLFFAVEKILGNMRSSSFAPLVVASVAAAAITRTGLAAHSALVRVPPLHGTWRGLDLAGAAVLGMLGGVVSVGYTRGIWLGRDLLTRVPVVLRIAVATLTVATLYALLPPGLLGVGTLDLGRLAAVSLSISGAIIIAKIVATSLTIGAAEVGGLFAPAIVTGAALGSGAGLLLMRTGLPSGLPPEGYALLGMTALVAGSAHAPLTAIFIVLEMTGDWSLILPLLLAGSLSYVTARSLYPNSVYSEWLARRGERIHLGTDEGVLARLSVASALDPAPVTLRAEQLVTEALRGVGPRPRTEYPVVDAHRRLTGILTFETWHAAVLNPARSAEITVGDLAVPPDDVLTASDTLLEALRRMGTRDAPQLPVVSADDDGVLLGVIGRREIFAAYEAALA